MRALVLSGGGARGAYQVGVWKALKKLNIKFDIVTGTSIGAINGMMYAQNSYYKCLNLWKTIDFSKVYNDFDSKTYKDIVKNYATNIINGGIDTEKIEKIIYDNYNPNKLYNSKINFGVVTYNLSTMEPVYATKLNTNPKKLKEYIMASATCFPVFKPTKVGKDIFIDGGIYDNMPINLAISLGATEILAIDLKAVGFYKKTKDKNVKIDYISPNNKINSFLMFENKVVNRTIKLGYYDTMKFYKELEGKMYTFKLKTIEKLYNKYKNKLEKLFKKYKINKNIDEEYFLSILEESLELLNIKVDNVYNKKSAIKKLNEEVKNIEITDQLDLKKIFDKKIITKSIYTNILNNDKINYNILNYKEFNIALFLYAIKE